MRSAGEQHTCIGSRLSPGICSPLRLVPSASNALRWSSTYLSSASGSSCCPHHCKACDFVAREARPPSRQACISSQRACLVRVQLQAGQDALLRRLPLLRHGLKVRRGRRQALRPHRQPGCAPRGRCAGPSRHACARAVCACTKQSKGASYPAPYKCYAPTLMPCMWVHVTHIRRGRHCNTDEPLPLSL